MNQQSYAPESPEARAIGLTDAMHARACELPADDLTDAVMAMADAAADAAGVACVLTEVAGDKCLTEDMHGILTDCAENASAATMNAMRAVNFFTREAGEPGGVSAFVVLRRLNAIDDMLADALRDLNAWDREVGMGDPAHNVVAAKNETLQLIQTLEKVATI